MAHEFWFTFGSGMRMYIGYGDAESIPDQQRGMPLSRAYTIVRAETEEEARERFVAVFGRMWAFTYTSAESAGVERYQLAKIPFPVRETSLS